MCKLLGPGILVAIAYLDPGNLAGDIEAGVKGGYHLLWVLMLSTLLGYFFQVYSIKIGLFTNKDLAKLCRKHFSPCQSILLWIMAEIAIIGADIQEVLGSAIALQILFNLPIWVGVLLSILSSFIILLTKFLGQNILETIFAFFLGIMCICFFINLSFIQPNLNDVLKGIFIPYIPR